MNVEAITTTIALSLVAVACVARLKEMGRGAHLCERIGYALAFGGALGSAAEWWWPRLDSYHGDTIFAVGCGLIAFSVLVRHLRDRLYIAIGRWDGHERRHCTGAGLVERPGMAKFRRE